VPLRRVLDRDEMIAGARDVAERGDRRRRVLDQCLLERRIGPCLGDDLRAIVRTDLGLVGLDDGIERGWLYIALFGQDRFERADADLHLGQLRAVLVVMIVIVVVVCHAGLRRSILR
jgi:hypothetical protein